MHLHRGQLPTLSRQIVKALVDNEDIEVVNQAEVERDVQAVLGNYVNDLEKVNLRARELVQQRGLPQGEYGRIKRLAAEQAGIKTGDEALDYLLTQLLQMLMHSGNVEEIYADDNVMRRRMRVYLRADDAKEVNLEAEVRAKLKHVKEGTRTWEIEYERMKAEIRRRKGLE